MDFQKTTNFEVLQSGGAEYELTDVEIQQLKVSLIRFLNKKLDMNGNFELYGVQRKNLGKTKNYGNF